MVGRPHLGFPLSARRGSSLAASLGFGEDRGELFVFPRSGALGVLRVFFQKNSFFL